MGSSNCDRESLIYVRCHQSGRFPRTLRQNVAKRVSGHGPVAASGGKNPRDPEEGRGVAGGGVESRYTNTSYLSRLLHEEKSEDENG